MNRCAAMCHRDLRGAPRVFLTFTTAIALLLPACGSSVPEPKTGPHIKEEPVIVPYPPPPAKVEVIPSPPPNMKDPVWIDGEWQWRSRRWVWQAGRWDLPRKEGYYARPVAVRLADGTLVYYAGDWKTPPKEQKR